MMENKIKEAFSSLTMPEGCEQKILRSLHKPTNVLWRTVTAVACVIPAILLLLTAVPWLWETEQPDSTTPDTQGSSFSNPEASEEMSEEYNDQIRQFNEVREKVDALKDQYDRIIHPDLIPLPKWLAIKDGGLYFTGGGAEEEISQLISEETPFTREFIDEDGILYYVAVGGNFSPENQGNFGIGWSEWRKKAPYDTKSWLGGEGADHVNADGETREWLKKAMELMDIPWPC